MRKCVCPTLPSDSYRFIQYERVITMTRFETEAQGTSEMASFVCKISVIFIFDDTVFSLVRLNR